MTLSLDVMRTELHAAVTSGPPGMATVDALCTTCVGLFGMDGAAVSLVLDGASSGTYGSSSEASRRMDEYQFTFGEGPCLDAVASRRAVLAPDLDAALEQRWPMFRGALLEDGVRGVFAVPIMLASACVGAIDLFRARPGPLEDYVMAGARLAAELASTPLLDLIAESKTLNELDGPELARAEDGVQSLPGTDRIEVYQATGMLISALDVDADEALARLRAHAMATSQTASAVARGILEGRLVLDRDPRDGEAGTPGTGAKGRG